MLLEIFGMECPRRPSRPWPSQGFRARASPQPVTEIDPALDAVVDALCAEWNSQKQTCRDAPDWKLRRVTPKRY